jgi:hypothetical protein
MMSEGHRNHYLGAAAKQRFDPHAASHRSSPVTHYPHAQTLTEFCAGSEADTIVNDREPDLIVIGLKRNINVRAAAVARRIIERLHHNAVEVIGVSGS